MMFKNKKLLSYYFGFFAEIYSSIYLRILFYNILKRRYKTPFGEIDLIAKKSNQIIFIEIKARTDISLMDFISKKQQSRINKAAEYFLVRNKKYNNCLVRFDAIFINKYLYLKHIKNYW